MPKGIYDHSNHKPTLGKHWRVEDTSKMKGRHPKSEFKSGENTMDKNVNWKGESVGKVGLHAWIKRRLAKPLGCNHCGEVKPLDLANKSHEYKRELDDWLWLCRRCHSKYDNNYPQLRNNHKFYNRWINEWEERRVST